MKTIRQFLNYELLPLKNFSLTVADVLSAMLIISLTWAVLYLLQRYVLRLFFKRRNIAIGQQYAVTQLVKYIIYPIDLNRARLCFERYAVAGASLSVTGRCGNWLAGQAG